MNYFTIGLGEILYANLIFLVSNLEVPTLNTNLTFLHTHNLTRMVKILTNQQQNYLNFDRLENFDVNMRKHIVTAF